MMNAVEFFLLLIFCLAVAELLIHELKLPPRHQWITRVGLVVCGVGLRMIGKREAGSSKKK